MSEKPKTVVIPKEPRPVEPFFAFVGGDDDGRDVAKPVGYNAQGRPLYAPRGFVLRIP